MANDPSQRAEAAGGPQRATMQQRGDLVRSDLIKPVRAALVRAADPERAVGQQRYMKSSMPFYGLTSPQLRTVLRPLLGDPAYQIKTKPGWEATIQALWDEATHREERYAALALARHRAYRSWPDAGSLDLYAHLVVTGAWWDLVDEIAIHLVGPVLRADRATVTLVLHRWSDDADMWLRRTSILAQLGAKHDTDTELLAAVILVNGEGSRFGAQFFIRKAIGWSLREYAKTDPAWVRDFVAQHGAALSGLSRREATKHL